MLILRGTLPELIMSGVLVLCAPPAVQAATVKHAPKAAAVKDIADPAAVTRAYEAQFDTMKKFPPTKVVVVNGFALQAWSNGPASGTALMQYTQGRGWTFVEASNDPWDAPSLGLLGVPEDVAHELIARTYPAN